LHGLESGILLVLRQLHTVKQLLYSIAVRRTTKEMKMQLQVWEG